MTNTDLFLAINSLSHQNPWLDYVMIFGAEYLIFICFALLFSLLIIGKTTERKVVLLAIFGLVISTAIRTAIQHIYFEPRPFVTLPIQPLISHAADAAFPSGHTTMIATMAFAFWFYNRRLRQQSCLKSNLTYLYTFFMLWIGFARIFVGVHYPLDILGGIVVGLLSISLAWEVIKYLRKKFLTP